MITKKVFISIILLLTYSLGFAHNFIPHHHDVETEVHEHSHENDGHNHHHHGSEEKSHEGHQHISHGDHYDEGLYDLIICFLHDANHHNNECDNHYFIPAKSNNSLSSKSQQLKLVATLLALTIEVEQPELTTYFNVNSTTYYQSHSIENSPLRGPPSQKC
ncbi:MAG: hypothetical protein COB15_03775 [Flavobacteriales bacterium]|nr:MAG: hypothetical protein COB15_03775 [Flavobacteriales bacterium]